MKHRIKRWFAVCLAMCMIGACACQTAIAEEVFTLSEENPYYQYMKLEDSSISICNDGNMIDTYYYEVAAANGVAAIPSSLDGYTVTAIERLYSLNAHTVIVPESVKEISRGAFEVCEELTALFLPEGIQTIGAFAFSSHHLKEVYIPSSVTYMGYYAFGTAPQTGEYLIPGGFDCVTDFVFYSYNNPCIVAAAEEQGLRHVDLGQFCKGDFDRSNKVDMLDAFAVYRIASGEDIGHPVGNAVADTDTDGAINMVDAMTIFSTASGE